MMTSIDTDSNNAALPWWLGQQDPFPIRGALGPYGAKHKSKNKSILVIDDEPNIADTVVEILNGEGYEAIACYDGQSAIDRAQKQCPDLVLADVVMPRMDGVETVIAIRNICPAARIILFSGQARAKDLLAGARARGHDFELLAKPIHPEQLLKKLAITFK